MSAPCFVGCFNGDSTVADTGVEVQLPWTDWYKPMRHKTSHWLCPVKQTEQTFYINLSAESKSSLQHALAALSAEQGSHQAQTHKPPYWCGGMRGWITVP